MSQNKIFIGNLAYTVSKEELSEFFSEFGDVTDVSIPTDRDTGKPRGFAFVEFESVEAAKNALSANGKEISGRAVSVDMVREKRK